MKLSSNSQFHRPAQRGFFLVVVLLMLAGLMLSYVAANGSRIATLKREIRLVEQHQIDRLKTATTNAAAPAAIPGSR